MRTAIAAKTLFYLILLHSAAGQPVLVNPDLITTMQGRSVDRPELFVMNVRCLVNTTDGKFMTVRETCDQVRALVDESRRKP
jgi:hypothetical protein